MSGVSGVDDAPGAWPGLRLHGCRTETGDRRHLTLNGEWTFCGYGGHYHELATGGTRDLELCELCQRQALELVEKLKHLGVDLPVPA